MLITLGESILIHSGAGGIGQSAINICKHYECDIYVTVGNEEKKRFIAEEFRIPENHIFSSRDVQFKYKILELTKGRGVDLVINSLTGEKLDASYELLTPCGRFVEIGKFDMVQNKQLSMFDFFKDISFIGVALDVGLMRKTNFAKDFFKWMHKNSTNGCVKPLNKIVFNANEADKAFRYMTTGKHIGKIVIRIRDEEDSRRTVMDIKPGQEMIVITKTYFNPNKVYIIIGGLGGFGLELIHWKISMGARKFLLTSRNGIKNFYQEFVINRLRKFGEEMKFFNVSIEVLKNDCLTVESAQQVLSEAQNMGRIGGIFHLGLVLNDCILEKMSYEQFCESIDCKYKVFDNLDKLSRKLNYNLDYFVIFSSVACGKGNAGQTNYAFGNSLCERICEQRRRDGLHGLAIQYGPIGDVGALGINSQVVEVSTLQMQRIHSCYDVLDKLLASKQSVVTSWVRGERVVQIGSRKKRLVEELWKALGIDADLTDNHLTLGEIGLESMFAVELQQELERENNMKINMNHIKTITVGLIKDYQKSDTGYIKKYLDEMKSNRLKLMAYNFTIPTEPYTKLNNVTKGRPIYFMPPFEITFSAYEEFAKKFDRPVIGLNWTRDVSKFEAIKQINHYFEDLLKKLEPKGDYDLVGSLDGALYVAKQLMKGRLRKGVIIDVFNDEKLLKEKVSEETILEFFFSFLSSGLPESFRDKIYRGIFSEDKTSGKIRRMTDEMKDFVGRGLIAPDLEEILGLAMKRATLLWEYRLKKKSKFGNKLKETIGKKWAKKSGKLHVIKAFRFDNVDDIEVKFNTSRDMYLLPDDQVRIFI